MGYRSNEAQYAQALAFEPVLPYPQKIGGHVAEEVVRQKEDGTLIFSFTAPQAESVAITMDDKELVLEKDGNGVFRGEVKKEPGFHYLLLKVDGMDVITPMLPIGFGHSRPVNYVEIGALPVFCEIQDVPHGSVSHEFYQSRVTGRFETCLVYLPPQYSTESGEFPVLYLQHGYGENETGWVFQGKMNFILDNLIAAGEAVPMIVVMNNGMVQVEKGEGRKVVHTVFEELLLKDVIPYIENRYRVKKGCESRAMAGLSMGSMQTCTIAFRHRDMFSWIGLFSGFMRDFIRPGEEGYLDILYHDVERFHCNNRLFFRSIGEDDVFYHYFAEDDIICEETGVKQVRKVYHGIHDWNVWRKAFRDFAQLLFQ